MRRSGIVLILTGLLFGFCAFSWGKANKAGDPPPGVEPPPPPWTGCCPFDPPGCPVPDPGEGGEPPGGGGTCAPVGAYPMYAPSAGDPVNLAAGVEAYRPTDDLLVYNPYGPRVVWRRHYYGGLAAGDGYSSPGLPVGWVHSYDITLQNTGESWDVTLVYPYGAAEPLQAELNAQGQPTGVLTPPSGSPYLVHGVPSPTPYVWQSVTITWRDQTQWTFVPLNGNVYVLSAITNRVGRSVTLTWDAGRRLLRVTEAGSGMVLLSLTYNAQNLVASVTDAYGRQVSYQYSVPANLSVLCLTWVSQVVPAGTPNPPMRYSYGYVAYGTDKPLLSSITVPSPTGMGSATSTLQYSNGRVVARVDASGNRTEYQYDLTGQATTVTVKDPAGNLVYRWIQKYTGSRCNAGTVDALGNQSTVEYNDPANPYRPTRIVDRDGKQTTYTYDAYGNVLTVTNPRGVTTTYTYDYSAFPLGRLVQVQEGSKPPTTYTYYEPSGLVQSVTSPKPGSVNGETVTTSYTYDALGNVLTVTAPGNNATPLMVTTYNYTQDGSYTQPAKVGQPLTVTDNLGNVTHYRYDARGNRTVVIDANGNRTDFAYNIADQLAEVQYPATGQQGSGRARTQNVYLYAGGPLRQVLEFDESGTQIRQVTYTYGAEGQLLQRTGSTEVVSYVYDAAYRVVQVRDGKGNATSFAYNLRGDLLQITYPGGDSVQFAYDAAGRVVQRRDGRGILTNYVYNDPEGLLTGIEYPAYPALNVSFTYDSDGRRASMTDATGITTYSYDHVGNLLSVSVTYAGLPTRVITYSYYPDGSRATMSTPAGTYTHSYDAAGRLVGLSALGWSASWTYAPNGWLLTQTLNGASTTYEYNARGFLTRLTNRDARGNVLSDFQNLRYDGVGNRTQMTVSFPAMPSLGGVTNYSYDTKNQLLQEQSTRVGGYTFTFVYDPAQNPTQFKGQSRTYNANNQLIGAGFAYDGNGNPVLYKGVNLSFDAENRMTAYGNILTAGYNGDGLRAWKQTASGRRYYLYDGEELVCELDAAGNPVAGVVFGANGLLVYGATGYQFDPQGNATHLMDDDGLVVAHLAYDAWGQRMSGNNPTPYGYKGQWGYYTDGETGLLLLTHRYLDPATGRFLTRDPIGVEGGINLYAYVGNGVVIGSDRSGLKLEFCTRPVGPCDQHNAKFCHWFFASTECGCVGYGPQGPHDDCSEHFGKKEHWCKRVNTTPSQERCICENFRNAQKGWKMCGEQWLPKGGKEGAYNWLDHNCQHFIICLARKCGVKYPFPPSLTPYHPKVY
ncbi:MAG: RHS repeat protein [Chthonomonadetes bacterium]|nr:RHS repeat protein [Chthonomonadetes bacterium]